MNYLIKFCDPILLNFISINIDKHIYTSVIQKKIERNIFEKYRDANQWGRDAEF